MAIPEHKDNSPSITTLKSHVSVNTFLSKTHKTAYEFYPQDLLHIFGYLDYNELLQCRLVCPHWYQIIKHEARLIDQFRYGLTLHSGTVISTDEPPFSIMRESKIKIKRITLKNDFLEPGNSIAVVEANRLKLSELSEILTDTKAQNTITEVIVHAKDNEPRTNALLMQMIMEMKTLNVLRFTLTAFVHSLETLCSIPDDIEQCTSLQHIQIMHTDCKRLILADFSRLFQIFPNINRIDVTPYETMLLGEDILQTVAPLIKSIEKLESYTLIELTNIQRMSLRHISYECCADDAEDVSLLHEFLTAHHEIETMSLKLVNGSSEFFSQPLDQLVDLDLNIKKSAVTDVMEEDMKLGNILQWTPNLKTFSVKYKGEHQFGHQVIEMKNLVDVTMTRFCLDCETCFTTILKSIANVTRLKFARHSEITVKQLTLISTYLQQLQCLELMFEDVSMQRPYKIIKISNSNKFLSLQSVELQNHFDRWPAMPKLKKLVVNRVGYLTNKGIANLQKSCPSLEDIKFYSLRGAKINGLLKLVFKSFPNLGSITFRGGRCQNIPQLNYINGKVGWRLKELDVSAYIQPAAIIKLFKNNNFLETVRCKYGALVVTRRIYYEAEILKAYTLDSIQQPLKSRKRLHMDDDMSSDSETSDSEASTSESSNEWTSEEDD